MARGKSAVSDLRLAGIDRLAHEMGVRLGLALGSALAGAVAEGMDRGQDREAAAIPAVRRCRVAACTRRAVAKGLCATHYRKAHRIGLAAPFDARALAALAVDGRKLRRQR